MVKHAAVPPVHQRGTLILQFVLLMLGVLWALPAFAHETSGETPVTCEACACGPDPQNCGNYGSSGNSLSMAEGNLSDSFSVPALRGGSGTLAGPVLTYNTDKADGSQARFDTVAGVGWTHSYNAFLYTLRGHMFRVDGRGRVTKYAQGAGGTFTADTGWFETLVKNPGNTYTLRYKDGTTYLFAVVSGTLFNIGMPVYRLQSITDRNGNVTVLTYAAGLLVSVADTYGHSYTFSYYPSSRLSGITDPLGRVTSFSYDASYTRLNRITDPLGKQTTYSYNTLYQVVSKVDRDGRTFTYAYNSANKPVTIRDGAGNLLATLANPVNWAANAAASALNLLQRYTPSTTSKTDGRANVWKYDYDANGYVTKVTAPDNAVTRYTYDPVTLRVATAIDANNRTTSYQYDARGNRIKTTDDLNNVTTYTYEPVFNQMTSMTDANGRTTSYQYNANGNRIKETDPLLQTREWSYDARGNVLTEKDRRGFVTTYLYDAAGNVISRNDPLANLTTMTYDAVGNRLTVSDANNHTTTYTYDALNRAVAQTDALGKTTVTTYDAQGNRVKVIDRNGNTTQYQYDFRQRLVQTTDALGKTIGMSYDGNDNPVSMTDKNNHATTMQYDSQNRLTQTTDALGNTSKSTYDGVGNRLSATDANNKTTTFQYDGLNRLTQSTDPVGNVAKTAYDAVGPCPGCTGPTRGSDKATRVTDGNGKVTYFKYDALDRQIRQVRKQADTADVEDGNDAVTITTYDANNNRLSITEPNGNATTYQYDALNRRTTQTNAAGDVSTMTYDGVGNVTTMTAPNGNVTGHAYDAIDRRTQTSDGAGPVSATSYDAVGNRLTRTDGNGNTTTYAYDAIYRVSQVTDPLGRTTSHGYDAVGNMLSTTDREGRTTASVYDNINRLTQMTDALGNVTRYQYDAVGNRTRVTDANNHATNYAYDGVNRLVTETYADGRSRTFAYDFVGNLTTRTDQKGQVTGYAYSDLYFLTNRTYPVGPADNMTYDLSGRMLSAERGGWLVNFAYDGANRVVQSVQNGKTVDYAYNIPGRTRALTYPGGRVVTEHTDARSRLDSIDDASPSLVQYAYDPGNRVVSRTYRNGTQATYAYNANDWATSLEHAKGPTRVVGFGYDHDKEGNRKYEDKRTDAGGSDTRSEAYQYDAIYRLVDYKVGTLSGGTVPVPVTQTQYTLDGVGNWVVKSRDGVPENRNHGVTNEITAIGGAPVVSDFNGNTIEDARYLYAYDEQNRLTVVTRKADSRVVGQYQYDALSRRVKKVADPALVSSPAETRYFHDDARIIEEQDAAGTTLATYVYGNYIDEILAMDRGGTYYYHQNGLWSVEAISDSAGNVVERYGYDAYGLPAIFNGSGAPVAPNPWGSPHSAIGNPWMFTGRQFDEEAGLFFYRARYYDANKGRYLQRDPLGYEDGLNLYEYARSNPVNWLDPRGTITVTTSKAEKLACGGRNVQWTFSLDNDAPCNGYIVQKITILNNVKNCVDCPNATGLTPSSEFWEAWYVKKGDKVSWDTKRDGWTDGSTKQSRPETCGYNVARGTIKFFCNTARKDGDAGTGDIGDYGRTANGKPGGWQSKNPGTEAGDLPSTTVKPGWWDKEPVESSASRYASSYWCCCRGKEAANLLGVSPPMAGKDVWQ